MWIRWLDLWVVVEMVDVVDFVDEVDVNKMHPAGRAQGFRAAGEGGLG